MKRIFIYVTLIFSLGCGTENNSNNTSDTTVNSASGNSDGSNTVTADTTHMDTSLNKITTDTLK